MEEQECEDQMENDGGDENCDVARYQDFYFKYSKFLFHAVFILFHLTPLAMFLKSTFALDCL